MIHASGSKQESEWNQGGDRNGIETGKTSWRRLYQQVQKRWGGWGQMLQLSLQKHAWVLGGGLRATLQHENNSS